MTISHDPNVPVYFFDRQSEQIKVGRFLRQSALDNIIVAVDTGNDRPVDHYYSAARCKFTNDINEARRDALKFYESELADKKQEITAIYKQIFTIKKNLRRPLISVIQQLLKGN